MKLRFLFVLQTNKTSGKLCDAKIETMLVFGRRFNYGKKEECGDSCGVDA